VILIIGDDFNEMRRVGGDIVGELRNIRGTASASPSRDAPILDRSTSTVPPPPATASMFQMSPT
jgi:hypothetical protein